MAHDDDAGGVGQAPECQICPICAGLALLRGARPEAVEHLAKAGVELLLAAKALFDGAAAPGEQPHHPGGRHRGRTRGTAGGGAATADGLQRIDIG